MAYKRTQLEKGSLKQFETPAEKKYCKKMKHRKDRRIPATEKPINNQYEGYSV